MINSQSLCKQAVILSNAVLGIIERNQMKTIRSSPFLYTVNIALTWYPNWGLSYQDQFEYMQCMNVWFEKKHFNWEEKDEMVISASLRSCWLPCLTCCSLLHVHEVSWQTFWNRPASVRNSLSNMLQKQSTQLCHAREWCRTSLSS